MHGTSSAEAPFPVTTFGGLVTMATPESLPEGASPRTWDTDFNVGEVRTRYGLSNVYTQASSSVGPNSPGSATSSTWTNPTGLIGSSGFASFSPAVNPNAISAKQFAFAIGPTINVAGVSVSLTAYGNAPVVLEAQLLINGVLSGNVKSVTLSSASTAITFGGTSDQWGLILTPAMVNGVNFGVQFSIATSSGFTGATAYLKNVKVSLGANTGQQTMQPFTTFVDQNGTRYNFVLDGAGDLYVEYLDSNPGALALTRTGIMPGSLCVSVQGTGVQYMAFVKPMTSGGNDMPSQWTPKWIDRITQVGPGIAPTFTASTASSISYNISTITQPAPHSYGYSYFLWSAGPGVKTPGNTVTFYYADSTVTGPDNDLVAAFNSGNPVYMYVSFTGTPVPYGPQVILVTAVGEGQPPGQPRNFYYFTFQVPTSANTFYAGSGHSGYTANYQRSLATLTTTSPVPNVTVGSQIAVTGVTPSNWNNSWKVTQTPNASEMVITGSQITAGVATFNYSVTNGTANPAVGELVTITNTLNAGGQLNVTQYPIATVTGGSTGTFTVNGYSGTLTAGFEVENGYADTAGTIFDFDPGQALLGTATNPIYGNASIGGSIIFNASGIYVDPGTYQGTVFFITRNGYYTAPAPPVVFTIPANTTELVVSNLPIGPPNVVKRGIAITEAGQNGVPGASFFTLPNDTFFYSGNTKETATSFFVNDNTSVSATLFFTSAVLNSATAIDIYGYNLFNQIEIGDPAWIAFYAKRTFCGQCLNKVQNLVNMSFDGGYLQSTKPAPAGWSQPDTYGSLVVSPVFGNAYYIQNASGGTLAVAGLIQQTAYVDSVQQPILEPNTGYSVRVWARSPSGATVGNLVVALVAGSNALGSFSIPLSSMTTSYNRFIGVVLPTGLTSIPSNATIQIYLENSANNADVEMDRVDLFDTSIPVLLTTVYASYGGLPEQFDGVTGQVIFDSENQQPVQCGTVLYDTFYAMKGWAGNAPGSSLYSLQESSGLEPADWNEPEVSQRSGGAIGPFAWAGGEQWLVAASRAGLYLFVGGQPGKMMQEIQEVWDAINWNAGASIWISIDLDKRKLLVGVPLPTPNFWLPDAPVNAAPTSPNVILALNYQGLDSGEELRGQAQMHTTMFGTLMAVDMRRKWSIWNIESPFGSVIQGPSGQQFRFGNGQGNSKVYALDSSSSTDDGATIDSCYTTSGAPNAAKRAQFPQLGANIIRWTYMVLTLSSGGLVNVRLLGNRLFYPEPAGYYAWTVPGGFTPGLYPLRDTEASSNFAASRTFYEFRQNDGNPGWSLSGMMLKGRKDIWNSMTGQK